MNVSSIKTAIWEWSVAAETAQANKWIDRGTAATCAVLVVAICYLLIKTLFLFLDSQAGAQPPKVFGVSSASTSSSQKKTASVDPTAIPLWNLFGKEGARDKGPTAAPKDVVAPKTNLQLVLHGVFVAKEEDNSTAIISEKRRDSKLYHIGDKLPGSATLAGVRDDRVLLNRQGRLEALYFPEKSSAKSSSRSSSKSSRSSSSNRKTTSRKTGSRSSRKGTAGTSGRVDKMIRTASSPQEVAKALQEEMGVNPADALKEMGLEMNNGRGYKITGAGSPLFSAIGGKPGYTLLSINGQQLGDPVDDIGKAEGFLNGENCKAVITMEDDKGNPFTSQFPLCPN